MLNGTDVTARTSFTANEFSQLQYVAGTTIGGAQSLVVVAQTGKLLSNGVLTQIVDSPAVQITASVTGNRSINAMSALVTPPLTADANVVGVVQQAKKLAGISGSAQPAIQTVLTPQLSISP